MNDVVLQNARVLAIDQVADDRTDKPSVAKAVTVEVDIIGAQRLSLASQVGSLSLALRKAGENDPTATRLVTLADLLNSKTADSERSRHALNDQRAARIDEDSLQRAEGWGPRQRRCGCEAAAVWKSNSGSGCSRVGRLK